MAELEGCIVTLDDYIVYYHQANNFPEGLMITTRDIELLPDQNQIQKKGEYKEISINMGAQQNIAYTTQQESLFLAHYMNKQKPTANNMINLQFEHKNTNKKQWILICSQDTKSKLKVGIICSIPNKIYYYKQDIMYEFNNQIAIIAKEFITKIPLTFIDYAEDYDADDEEHINEMPLYILRIRCKTIFFNLFSKFQKSYCWLKCRCTNPTRQTEIQNRDINRELNINQTDHRITKRFLLIGPPNSGKNTFMKQLRIIHGKGYTNKDRNVFIKYIHRQIIEQMQNIIDEFTENERKTQLEMYDNRITGAISIIDEIKFDDNEELIWSDDIVNAIEVLWNNQRIQSKAEMMNGYNIEYRIYDSSIYFWNELPRIKQKDYIPTDKDIIMVKYGLKSGCMDTLNFYIRDTKFEITKLPSNMFIDCNSKKWLNYFSNMTAVIFVANIDHPSIDSIESELDLFDNVCNSRWFRRQTCILFLNKKDILNKNIQKIPFDGGGLDEYIGPNEIYSIIPYIRNKFEERNNTPRSKQIYTHITVATDKTNVERVFGDIQHIVINTSLQRGGLLGFPSPKKTKKIKEPKMIKVADKSTGEAEIMEMVQLNQVEIIQETDELKKQSTDQIDISEDDFMEKLKNSRKNAAFLTSKPAHTLIQKEKETHKIEKIDEDILELKDVFTDLNVLVNKQ
eukprot:296825_1